MILLDKTIFSAFPLRVAVGIASNPETNLSNINAFYSIGLDLHQLRILEVFTSNAQTQRV
ncbi:hypothetical protein [Nostoc sp.]|uniref:hypothetical protein n=1 Tax=Nostoc sp. TaxID=1180 RepID=UPI002FFC2EC2